jgi:murein DD-endopeptidase MepM/ murein hydrolase activator NlpD
MPGPSLPAVLAAAAITVAAVAAVPDTSVPPIGPAAAVRAPAPAAAAPHQQPAPAAGVPATAPRPGHGWRWPLVPRPQVGRRFAVGPRPWSPGHRGVDLLPASAAGAPVVAAGPAVVRFVGVVAGRGVVSLDHGSGVRTTYEPVTASVRAGAAVVSGQVIGTLASTGSHCGVAACLHWGASVAGRYIDPLSLLRPRDPAILLPIPASR